MTLNNDGQAQWRHEYDQRQYLRMLQRLEAFEAGHLHLAQLAGDLGTLLGALEETPDETWADAFSALCEELDIMNSVATVRAAESSEKIAFSVDEIERCREIAGSLKRLVAPKIDDPR